jgi:FAD:protein FMN transferase
LRAALGAALLAAAIASPETADPPPSPSLAELRMDGRTQGTTYRVRGFTAKPLSPAVRQDLEDRVEGVLRRIDELMSSWRQDSEIEGFNRLAAGVPFTLSAENAGLLARSREIWGLTDGAFDPTIGRSIRLWGFGGAPRRHDLPGDADVAAALADGGFGNVDLQGRTIRKLRDGVCIDLNGIAQGYSVDRVFELLRRAGFDSLLVEIGGEVRAGAPPPGERAWRVGVESPDEGPVGPTMALVETSVSTSGDYRNSFEADGVRYSHILDPRIGRPVQTGVASATVVARDCATADALATAVIVLGPEKALALIEGQGAAACRLLVREGDAYRERVSAGFSRWLW